VYIGTADAEQTAGKAAEAGGTVIAPPFDVGDQGRMAVLQDPCGAVISIWQPARERDFLSGAPNTMGWVELNGRGVDKAIAFYEQVFGWTAKQSPMGENMPPYTEFQIDGQSIAGGMEMNPQVPAQVPSYWLVYFGVSDVDETARRAKESGAQEMVPPMDFPGGRFAVLADPQGATFGLLRMSE
jgi:predicted enzyme related to lactoylglutathione lyase